MKISEAFYQSIKHLNIPVYQITTGIINYADNPVKKNEFDLFLCDFDLYKLSASQKKYLFENNQVDGKIDILSYKTDYIGHYISLTENEFLSYNCELKETDNIYNQLLEYQNNIDILTKKFTEKPRTLKKRLKENQQIINNINHIINKHKAAGGAKNEL